MSLPDEPVAKGVRPRPDLRLPPVLPENSNRATHRGSGRTLHSSYSFASTGSVPCAGVTCSGDIANVCQQVECRWCGTGSAIGHLDRVFGRDNALREEPTCTGMRQ